MLGLLRVRSDHTKFDIVFPAISMNPGSGVSQTAGLFGGCVPLTELESKGLPAHIVKRYVYVRLTGETVCVRERERERECVCVC